VRRRRRRRRIERKGGREGEEEEEFISRVYPTTKKERWRETTRERHEMTG
jgi:hypothetical protein